MTTLAKTYLSHQAITANGSGLWGVIKGTVFMATAIEITYTEFEDSTWGFVNVYHNLFGGQGMKIEEAGLPYTDKSIEKEVNAILAANPEIKELINGAYWSEQGMQAYGMMNFDADVKGNREDFEAAGFKE